MKGGVDHEDDDEYEDPLDPASTVDFNMQGLKSKLWVTDSLFYFVSEDSQTET